MILQTMNDDEKTFEAYRIYPVAYGVYQEYYPVVINKFIKGKKFPYFNRVSFTDDRGNKWILVYECPSKAFAKKGILRTFCYTIYNVFSKKGNGGKGILFIDPVAMYLYAEKKADRKAVVMDIVPHVFNRFTERYLKTIGKEGIDFEYKVEMLMSQWLYFDIMGDKSSENHTDKGQVPYDVFFKNGGILRGYLVNDMLLRFFTYLNKDMLFDEQKQWYDENIRELWKERRRGALL